MWIEMVNDRLTELVWYYERTEHVPDHRTYHLFTHVKRDRWATAGVWRTHWREQTCARASA